jgi:hypothetical protein
VKKLSKDDRTPFVPAFAGTNGEKPDSLLSSRQRGAGAINHVLDSERGKEHAEQT